MRRGDEGKKDHEIFVRRSPTLHPAQQAGEIDLTLLSSMTYEPRRTKGAVTKQQVTEDKAVRS